uniref:Uncharacterized protein n=1 Tax=Meloidogyne hapla TaxID=6305 RepID=A0A1I8BJF7_MELHA
MKIQDSIRIHPLIYPAVLAILYEKFIIKEIIIENDYLHNIIDKDILSLLNGEESKFQIFIDNISNLLQGVILKYLFEKIIKINEENEKEKNNIIENEIKEIEEENQKIFEKELETLKANIDNLVKDSFCIILQVYKIFKMLEENVKENEKSNKNNENLNEDKNKSKFILNKNLY